MDNERDTKTALVSIVIVNFNGGDLLGECVLAALSATVPVEVILIDNGSSDGSMTSLRTAIGTDARLRVIENGRNLGFAHACNQGLTYATGKYVLLLNPDCVIQSHTLAQMIEAMDAHPQAGMAGSLIRNPDGTEQAGCRRTVPTPWRSLVRVLHLNRLFPHYPQFQSFLLNRKSAPAEPVFVEAISGAFMLVRHGAIRDVGLLDEGYFLHCEDLDWCMRFSQTGWKILFVPNVEVVHYKGRCSVNRPFFVEWHKHKGMVRFYRKYFRHRYPLPLQWLVELAVWARFLVLAAQIGVRRVLSKWRALIIPAFGTGRHEANAKFKS